MKKKVEHEFTISQAIKMLSTDKSLKHGINESQLRENWEKIVGKTIAQYTDNIYLSGDTVTVYFRNSVVKNEMNYNKENALKLINEFFGDEIVKKLNIK